ncbi:acetyltransferase (GNAT) family protein [Flavobacterium cutihirudinis]|uniref:Acetyltransferase (GNAT) family protein n=1 Tax=Flavobacterium cutihirudinis TaxID=1265740 RepID=A0A3D9FWZ6_9FLAO|nr:GNAT family N-acetyltransferase [Flavobacterium cutihirudinis]RED24637.1 acetyltransferase (GNAT) family protein [Flavobacterium cutihirudinis]
MTIEKANITDNEILTSITKKSKAYWGYSAEQIQKWDKNLTISQDYIRNNATFKLIDNDLIIGYYSYVFENEKEVELDNLFILPEHIGKGLGKYLLLDFLNRMKEEKIERITLNSEPNAESFYSKMGFIKIGEFETSIKNRFMPIMEMKL